MKTAYTSGQLEKFNQILGQKGVDHDKFQIGLSTGLTANFAEALATVDLSKIDRQAFRKALGLDPDPIILVVDYGKGLEAMIAAGSYDWKNGDLTAKRFPVTGEGVVEFEAMLVDPTRKISSEQAIDLINRTDTANPWMPAQTEHLLAYGAKYPDAQRKNQIVALGSVSKFDGVRYVPCILGDGSSGRFLDLRCEDIVWGSRYRFLAVRKVSRPSAT